MLPFFFLIHAFEAKSEYQCFPCNAWKKYCNKSSNLITWKKYTKKGYQAIIIVRETKRDKLGQVAETEPVSSK